MRRVEICISICFNQVYIDLLYAFYIYKICFLWELKNSQMLDKIWLELYVMVKLHNEEANSTR